MYGGNFTPNQLFACRCVPTLVEGFRLRFALQNAHMLLRLKGSCEQVPVAFFRLYHRHAHVVDEII